MKFYEGQEVEFKVRVRIKKGPVQHAQIKDVITRAMTADFYFRSVTHAETFPARSEKNPYGALRMRLGKPILRKPGEAEKARIACLLGRRGW